MIPGLQIEESDPILKLLLFSHEDLYDAYFTALQALVAMNQVGGGGSIDYLELCSGYILYSVEIYSIWIYVYRYWKIEGKESVCVSICVYM